MQLDDAYANAAFIDGAEAYPPRWIAQAGAFRKKLGPRAEIGISYGPTERQALDFFNAAGPPKGTVIFVHGGYWKAFDRSYWSHLAKGALAKGWAVAMPSYDLCPDVRISEITGQIAAAVSKVAQRTQGPLVLAGHSAGGHLVARMLDPQVLEGEVRDRITHVMPISPVADLEPLMQTSMNEVLRIDPAEAAAESPVLMPRPQVKVTVCVGADERPAFLEQAQSLAKAWGAGHVVDAGKHHFDVIDGLAEADSAMTRALLG